MLILKSSSPRRQQILENLGLRFTIDPPQIDETPLPKEHHMDFLKRVTIKKLEINKTSAKNLYVASDTIVVFLHEILQKPKNQEEALSILLQLSGRKNTVFSSIGMYTDNSIIYDFNSTDVYFKKWNENDVMNYIKTHDVMDKAGAYAIQDPLGPVQAYSGSFTNVMGFPLRQFLTYHSIWSKFLKP